MSAAPIFVVGFQRSGTTLLQSLIGSHPRIAAPPETYFLFRIVRSANAYGDLADDGNLRRAVHDALHPPLDLFSTSGFVDDAIFERARSKPRSMRGLFEAVMEDFAERHGKQRWSDKTPGQRADEIHRTFPDAQLVHIVRDPRDVVASSLSTPWTRAGPFELAHNWRRFTRSNVRHGMLVGPRLYLQITYEHLTRDPVAVLERVCAFVGEEFDPRMVTDVERRRPTVAPGAAPWQERALGTIEPAVEGRWMRTLSRRDQVVVESIVGGELAALGYERASMKRRVAGSVLVLPDVIARRARERRMRGRARDAQWRERAMRDFLEAQAARVRDVEGTSGR